MISIISAGGESRVLLRLVGRGKNRRVDEVFVVVQADSLSLESATWLGSGLSERIPNDCLRLSRIVERRREVKSLKSTVLERMGRRIDDTLLGDVCDEGIGPNNDVGILLRRASAAAGGDD